MKEGIGICKMKKGQHGKQRERKQTEGERSVRKKMMYKEYKESYKGDNY